MESHKRILAILFIISGTLEIVTMLFLSAFFSLLMPFIANEAGPDASWVFEFIVPFFQLIVIGVIVLLSIPSIIGGIALLNKKPWGLTVLLVVGCIGIFSFPIGTALGIYTIWVFAKDRDTQVAQA